MATASDAHRPIPVKRLQSIPWAAYCVRCQEQFEAGEEEGSVPDCDGPRRVAWTSPSCLRIRGRRSAAQSSSIGSAESCRQMTSAPAEEVGGLRVSA